MSLPNKIKSVEPNYHRDDAVILLERYFDEWSNCEDWWGGGNTWDLNIFTEFDEKSCDYGLIRTINVRNLEMLENGKIQTGCETIDYFELKL